MAVFARSMPAEAIGHLFRARYLDACSRIEHWAAAVLRDARVAPSKAGTYLFGQKLAAVRAVADAQIRPDAQRRPLKYPKRVIALLDQLQPYAELRSTLAHAVQTVLVQADGSLLFLFAPPGRGAAWKTVSLTEPAQRRILATVERLAREFAQQALRP